MNWKQAAKRYRRRLACSAERVRQLELRESELENEVEYWAKLFKREVARNDSAPNVGAGEAKAEGENGGGFDSPALRRFDRPSAEAATTASQLSMCNTEKKFKEGDRVEFTITDQDAIRYYGTDKFRGPIMRKLRGGLWRCEMEGTGSQDSEGHNDYRDVPESAMTALPARAEREVPICPDCGAVAGHDGAGCDGPLPRETARTDSSLERDAAFYSSMAFPAYRIPNDTGEGFINSYCPPNEKRFIQAIRDAYKAGAARTRPAFQEESFDAGVFAAAKWCDKHLPPNIGKSIRLELMDDPNCDYTCGTCGKLVKGKYLFCSNECTEKSGLNNPAWETLQAQHVQKEEK